MKVIDDNVFEEGLSTHEYPDIDVTWERKGLVVSVGAMLDWKQWEGDFVLKSKNAQGNPVYRFRRKDSEEVFNFTVRRTSSGRQKGKLTLKRLGERARIIAVAYCRQTNSNF